MAQDEAAEDGILKILLVADERFHGEALVEEIQRYVEGKATRAEVFVIAPAVIDSAIEDELGGVDPAMRAAGKRLEWLIGELKSVGIEATGQVGDQDPVVAAGDGLREFDADELVVVAHARGERTPAEKGLWAKLEADTTVPLAEISVHVDEDGVGEVVKTEEISARAMTETERIQETSNFPPMSTRDIVGVLVAFLGTIAIGLIAVESALDQDRGIDGVTAAILIIAVPTFLINAAYISSLLIFKSVGYTGVWFKFFERVSMFWTLGGIALSLLLWAVW
jgi:hypothetical protein